MTDDEAARKTRAADLEEQIDELTSPHGPEEAAGEAPPDENPRDFIHRRMSELEEDKGKQEG